jgi:hypothetical protein
MLDMHYGKLVIPEKLQKRAGDLARFFTANQFPFAAGKVVVLNIDNQ